MTGWMVVKPDIGKDDIQTSFFKPIDEAVKSRSSSAKSDVGDPLDLFPRYVRFHSFAEVFECNLDTPIAAIKPIMLNPARSILKHPQPEFAALQGQHAISMEAEKTRCMQTMLAGTVMLKYNAKGKPESRFVKISADGTELIWTKMSLPRTRSRRFNLATVRGIVFGPNTIRFLRFDWENSKPWMCLSLVCDGRTVDFCIENERDFLTWYLGLQHLIPLSSTAQTRGSLLWTRAIYKVSQRAYKAKTTQLQVWMDLFYQAKRDCAAAASS